MSLALADVFEYMDEISEGLDENVLVKDVRDGLLHQIDSTEQTEESLAKIIIEYSEHLVFTLLGIVIERAFAFPLLEKEKSAITAEVLLLTEEKNKYIETKELLAARVSKEQAKIDADILLLTEEKNKHSENKNMLEARRGKEQEKLREELALLVMQGRGFSMNDKLNAMTNTTEMIALFAQNEVDPEAWMKTLLRKVSNDLG